MAGNEWFKPVAAAALARFDAVMDTLGLSGGKNSGREYLPLNPKRNDHKPRIVFHHRDKGAWMEGATGDKGGDLISLAAYLWDCGNGEAAERLGKQLGIEVPSPPEWRQKRRSRALATPRHCGRLKSYQANRASRRPMMTAYASCRFPPMHLPRRRCTRGTASRPPAGSMSTRRGGAVSSLPV
jgi:hypothetical protein